MRRGRPVAGLLFDLGTGRYTSPPLSSDATAAARAAWEADLAQVRADAQAEKARVQAEREDVTHTEVQGWLRDLGRALGFHVWIAANDRSRQYQGARPADGCLIELPPALADGPAAEAISLIDVLWLEPEGAVAAAFEVEHTTSIYSGIVRMLCLALSGDPDAAHGMYLVAPDAREEEVRSQTWRPAFSRVAELRVRLPAVRRTPRQPGGHHALRPGTASP